MKIVKTDWRSRLTDDSLSDLMLIKLDSPDVQEFDPQPAIDVWMQKKRMPDFNDRGSRREAGREVEGDPDLVGPQKAHDVILALPLALDKQAATPGPSTEVLNISTMLLLKTIMCLTITQMMRMRVMTY